VNDTPTSPPSSPEAVRQCTLCSGTGSIPNGTDEMACGRCSGTGEQAPAGQTAPNTQPPTESSEPSSSGFREEDQLRRFSWKHPWSNAADTYLAQRLSERYLYVYPGRDYSDPGVRDRLLEFNRRAMCAVLGLRRRTTPAESMAPQDTSSEGGKP
jgi:hypothetical protein